MATDDWLHVFEDALVEHENFNSSDHRPLIIHLKNWHRRKHPPFRFKGKWQRDSECRNLISEIWQHDGGRHSQGSVSFTLKLNDTAKSLWKWSRECSQNSKRRLEEIQHRINEINEGDLNDNDRVEEKLLKRELTELWHKKEIFWQQRSRITWLNDGDKNSKFFHFIALKRRQRNRISGLN